MSLTTTTQTQTRTQPSHKPSNPKTRPERPHWIVNPEESDNKMTNEVDTPAPATPEQAAAMASANPSATDEQPSPLQDGGHAQRRHQRPNMIWRSSLMNVRQTSLRTANSLSKTLLMRTEKRMKKLCSNCRLTMNWRTSHWTPTHGAMLVTMVEIKSYRRCRTSVWTP